MEKLSVAVIGIGRMGSIHAANLKKRRVKNARLCAVCDIKPDAISRFTEKHGKVNAYSDFKEMLETERPDAVIVATEHYFHADIAIYCIEHGVATLVEKPLAVTTMDAKRVIDCAKAHPGVVAAVMFNQRTNPLYRRAKALVDGGSIGKIQRINFIITDWYRSQAYYNQGGWRASLWGEGGGVLINQCVHQLDLLQWIVGMPGRVVAKSFTKGRKITTENDVTALMRYGDVYCTFTASTHELSGTNRLEIAGDKGRIVIDKYKMKVTTYLKSEPEVNAETKFGYGFVGIRKVSRYSHGFGFLVGMLRGGQQLNIVKNFLAAVSGREQLISPIADGLNAVELINSMYLSSWEGREITLPVDDTAYVEKLKEKIEEERQLSGGIND